MATPESADMPTAPPFVPPHNPKTPALTSALTIKQGNLFLLTEQDGNISEGEHVYGLYFHDCRFLCQASLRVDGVRPVMLYATAEDTNVDGRRWGSRAEAGVITKEEGRRSAHGGRSPGPGALRHNPANRSLS